MTHIKTNINLIAQSNELKNIFSNVSTTIIKVIEQSFITKFPFICPEPFSYHLSLNKNWSRSPEIKIVFSRGRCKLHGIVHIFLQLASFSQHGDSEIHLHCGTHQQSVINGRIASYCMDISYNMDTAWIIVCITICLLIDVWVIPSLRLPTVNVGNWVCLVVYFNLSLVNTKEWHAESCGVCVLNLEERSTMLDKFEILYQQQMSCSFSPTFLVSLFIVTFLVEARW